jgi:predicted acetyltransferase
MMTKHAEQPSAKIEVIPATLEQRPILGNLLEPYAYDFGEFHDLELGADSRFGYKNLPLYWREPARHPLLVRIDGELGGFVLVKKGSEVSGDKTVWDMAEFFIVRRHRRHGIGTAVAHKVWRRFPGPWEVRVMDANRSAHLFWELAIALFAGEEIYPGMFEKDGQHWQLFNFESLLTGE